MKKKKIKRKIYPTQPVLITTIPQCLRIVKEAKLMNTFRMTIVMLGGAYLLWGENEKDDVTLERILGKIVIPNEDRPNPVYRYKHDFLEWLTRWQRDINQNPKHYKELYLACTKRIKFPI
jgi:hypothetical protein